ncbi:MAG: hypothetical protein ACKO5C_05080 [Ferruginibacter sp.]
MNTESTMIQSHRQSFNQQFTDRAYQDFLAQVSSNAPGCLDFRIAETPVFVPVALRDKMLDTCEAILDLITDPEFKEYTENSIPPQYRMPGESERPEMLVFDFGVCRDAQGVIQPQLIEMQGFPSMYGHQLLLDECFRAHFSIPENVTPYLNGYTKETTVALLRDMIIGTHHPGEVILLDVYPEKQKTRIDFYLLSEMLGIPIVCVTDIRAEGNKLTYLKNGTAYPIARIFNRMIFDDLEQHGLSTILDWKKRYAVEWIPHPQWFYRISKYTMPFLHHPHVPDTFFLNAVKQPLDLTQYVLKPLFSFAGQGVIIDVTPNDIASIPNPENWILQRKVHYAPIVQTPDEPAVTEIRLFYFWKKEWSRPKAVYNLARLSKGKMVGTRYNQDKTWVGGTLAYFEKSAHQALNQL